jgi:NDP-sugar pyrophosphorylase family protein
MIEHQVAALAEAGVTDIVLAVNYRPEVMTKELQKVCRNPAYSHLPTKVDISVIVRETI